MKPNKISIIKFVCLLFVACFGIISQGICVKAESLSYDFLWQYNDDKETISVIGFSGEACGDLVIPEEIDGHTVTAVSGFSNGGASGFTGSLVIPGTVKTIGESAFVGCTGLTGQIWIRTGVRTIGDGAFQGLKGLTGDLSIPNTVTSIGKSAFWGCSGLNGKLVLSNSLTAIQNNTFTLCTGLKGTVTIPQSVKTIGDGAFQNCQKLSGDLIIPNGVVSIGKYAFENCSFDGKLILPNTLERIGEGAFLLNTKFTGDLTIPNSVRTLGRMAFANCGFDGKLSISNAIDSIEEHTFSACYKLKGKLTIPNKVKKIGESAFSGCYGLSGDLIIPDTVIAIGESAFNLCDGFDGKLVLSNSIDNIEKATFYRCTGLKGNIVIPDAVKTIGDYAFRECEGFDGYLTIGSSVTRIGSNAFEGCENLSGSLVIPNSVTDIGVQAFMYCKNMNGKLVIPSTVKSVGSSAFWGCYGFETIENNSNIQLVLPKPNAYWYDKTTGERRDTLANGVVVKGDKNGPTIPTPVPDKTDENNPTPTQGSEGNAENASENIKSFVGRLYTVALGRNYDDAGLDEWSNKLTNGIQTGAEVAQGFIFSEEFKNRNLSDSDFVDTLYRTMFGREADEGGKATWMKALNNGMSREYVYHGFAEGAEFKNLCDSYGIKQGTVTLTQNRDKNEQLTAFVARNYTKALGRAAEEAGINDWTGRILEGKATPADVTAGFIFSPEFVNKGLSNEEFLKVLYQTYFDRDPDDAGYNGWMEQLNNGVSREYVVNTGFSCSQEFANLVASFGL